MTGDPRHGRHNGLIEKCTEPSFGWSLPRKVEHGMNSGKQVGKCVSVSVAGISNAGSQNSEHVRSAFYPPHFHCILE